MRHLTVTGFLVHEGRILLHWHRRNHLWLPMGGHIEPDEDPIQAVLREVAEECGVRAEVIPTVRPLPFHNLPQLPPPVTILVARVKSCGAAQRAGWPGPVDHIDLVYYCRPVAGLDGFDPGAEIMHWVSAADLEADLPLAGEPGQPPTRIPEDVRILGLDALRLAAQSSRERRTQ